MQDRASASQMGDLRQFLGEMTVWDKVIIVGSLIAFGMFFLDPLVLHWARELDPNVRHIFWTITDAGKSGWVLILTGTAVLAFVALAYRATHRRLRIGRLYAGQIAAFIFISVAATGLFSALCKALIGRARPKLYDEVGSFHFSPFAFEAEFASFPSGHATTTFALATALAVLWPRFAVPLFTAAVWIAASRFLMGAHYVSDVVAGAFVGTVGTLMIRQAFCARRSIFRQGGNGPCLRGRRIANWFQTHTAIVPGWALRPSEWLDRLAPERTPLGELSATPGEVMTRDGMTAKVRGDEVATGHMAEADIAGARPTAGEAAEPRVAAACSTEPRAPTASVSRNGNAANDEAPKSASAVSDTAQDKRSLKDETEAAPDNDARDDLSSDWVPKLFNWPSALILRERHKEARRKLSGKGKKQASYASNGASQFEGERDVHVQ